MEKYFWYLENPKRASDVFRAIKSNKNTNEIDHLLVEHINDIYKYGYSNTKYNYIRNNRSDIINAVQIIEKYWLKYQMKNNYLEMSMDFSDMRLDFK